VVRKGYLSSLPVKERRHFLRLTFANGALNQSSKLLMDLKMKGRRKFKRAHNSGKLFCRGVPVKRSLCLEM